MKCPYCGIYCADDERECPVCGKRFIGVSNPQKRSTNQPHKEIPHQPKKQPAAQSTERKQTYGNKSTSTESAWQKAAAGQHIHDNPLEHKKPSSGIGCLIVIIMVIVLTIFTAMGNIGYNMISDFDISEDFSSSFEDDIYEDTDISSVLTGVWRSSDGFFLSIDEQGTVSWSDADGMYSDDEPLFQQIHLTEENQAEYCSDDEIKKYPLDSFAYYYLYVIDTDSTEEMHVWFYLPQGETSPNSFDCYNIDTEENTTFTFVSDQSDFIPLGPEQQS